MNALTIDPATGFLQSPGPRNTGFTADKKLEFLKLAEESKRRKVFPPVSDICDLIGIDIRSFDRHLVIDSNFKSKWDELSTHIEYQCISDLSDLRRKNPMYMFGLLRYLNPKRWNPNEKQTIDININAFASALKDAPTIKDAELVESSPAIAPQLELLPSENQLLTKDSSTVDATGGAKNSPTPPPSGHGKPLPPSHHKKRGRPKNFAQGSLQIPREGPLKNGVENSAESAR